MEERVAEGRERRLFARFMGSKREFLGAFSPPWRGFTVSHL
jgi:hypothetical protein